MTAEPTISECLEAISAKDEEIERLQSLVSTLKGAANDLRRYLAGFADPENWFPQQGDTPDDVTYCWERGVPTDIAYKALRQYDMALKSWDDAHPTGAEQVRL